MHTEKVGSGLQNLGNTCFFNAVIQTILHNKKLAQHFSYKQHSKNCQNKQWCSFCQMQKIWQNTKNSKIFAPKNMIYNLKKIFKKFKLGRQQDSHQFLRYLIQSMQESETGTLTKDQQKNDKLIKKSKIFEIFGGVIKNTVKCLNCKHSSITTQRYYDFNIQCQRSDSLIQGLDKFFATDQLKGPNKYLCQNCKVRSDAKKRFYLDTAPNSITFQFKRFNNLLRKIGKFIHYPKQLNLGKYYQQERQTIFRVYAVIVHAGGSSYSGHYYAYVRVGQNWFRMDDSYVSKTSQKEAMGQNAYILFYEKVKDQPAKSIFNKIMTEESVGINNTNKKQSILKQINVQQKQVQSQKKHPIMNGIHKDEQIENKQELKNPFKREKPAQVSDDEEDQNQDDESLQVPNLLTKKTSKQQAQSKMTLQQIILKYSMSILSLHSKMAYKKAKCKSLKPITNLRKYQVAMKKRKLQI